MSNQFYKYISNKFLDYFNSTPPKEGDKFLINFDSLKQVNEFLAVLKKEDISDFVYKYEDYSEFKTFKLTFNNIELIVADSSVTPDFLVTLRNLVSKAEGEWSNKALLIISNDIKDSINEGMKNLNDEGYPLNLNYIVGSLEEDIDKSALSNLDKEVLKTYLETYVKHSLYKTTLWDFEYVLSIITKGFIEKEDYKNLDLFYDSSLENIKYSESRKRRIKENNKLFLSIEHKANLSNYKDELEKQFDNKGVKKLEDLDNWKDNDYEFLLQSQKNFNDKTKKINLEEIKINVDLPYWEKAESTSAAGKRKRNIILFNTNGLKNISLSFKFDNNLNRSFLNKRSKKFASISKNTLNIEFPVKPNEVSRKRIIYQHEDLSKNKFTLNVLVLNVQPDFIQSIKNSFKFIDVNGKIVIDQNNKYLEFGEGDILNESIFEENQDVIVPENSKVIISLEEAISNLNEDVIFNIVKNGNKVPIKVKTNEYTSPINSELLWNLKLENKWNFIFDGALLFADNQRYTLKDDLKNSLNLEKQIIEGRMLSGEIKYNDVENIELKISDELKFAYDELFDYYNANNNIPSLFYLNDDLKEIYSNIVEIFNNEVESIEEGHILARVPEKLDLNKLGVFKNGNNLYYSPLSPLNLAYQLEVVKNYRQDFKSKVSKKLNPNYLLPYICNENNEYLTPSQMELTKEWVVYEHANNVSIGSTNLYLKRIVEEKLQQFITHFKYLFKENSKAPLIINVINIENDLEVVKGVFNFIKERLNDNIVPIEVNIYNKKGKTYFKDLFKCSSSDDIKNLLNIEIESGAMDSLDVIRLIQENINYYVNKDVDDGNYDYSHISFYKQKLDDRYADLDMNSIETGLYLNGLLSSSSAQAFGDDYRMGFGVKYANKDNFLTRTSFNLNELAYNNQNEGYNTYSKNKTLVKHSIIEKDNLTNIYNKSHWVTFIEPNFDLDYFSNQKDLFIIHYSDKYSSLALYDTITVSNKSNQYKLIIEDFLKDNLLDYVEDENVINNIINTFNSINGEFLLNLGLNEFNERDKISIISAIKYALTIFDNEHIVWIPISMEEILRIAENMGLTESGGLFTVSNLIGKRDGKYSDDILLMGLNVNTLELYYYPIEVKIGNVDSKIISKAKKQITLTQESLIEFLASNNSFTQKFYRNFFVQLFLTNQQKLSNNKIWPIKNFEEVNKFKKELINDEYIISNGLKNKIGNGAIISFNGDATNQSIHIEDEVAVIELPMYDGYFGIIEPINEINKKLHDNKTGIRSEKLLCTCDVSNIGENTIKDYKNIESFIESTDVVSVNEQAGQNLIENSDFVGSDKNLESDNLLFDKFGNLVGVGSNQTNVAKNDNVDGKGFNEDIEEKILDVQSTKIQQFNDESKSSGDSLHEFRTSAVKPLSEVRALIGNEIENPDNEIYWEFGNSLLANRHMLVQGKSGQGKTYFMQKIIEELSFQNIPTIIIDYTNSFKKQQLDINFKESMNSKLKYNYVIKENLPLNPFKRYELEIDEDLFIKQKNEDIAARFKSIISDIYNLGDQQANAIYKSIIGGLAEYGEEHFDLNLLRHILENNDSNSSKTALTKLIELFDRNPFDVDGTFDWSILDKKDGKVLVIQLAGLSKELQRVVSEIILWDLWHYKTVNGTKDKPFAVVLDECQNLDFADGSPCSKILTEGRKFGWSGLFATQSIKGSFNSEEISKLENVDEKIYFHPTDSSISDIAKTLAKTSNREKNQWEVILSSLTRGNCIVNGATLNSLNDLRYRAIPVKVGEIEKKSIMDDFNGDGNHPGHDDVNRNSYGDKSSSDSQFGEGASANTPEDNPKINCNVEKDKFINESAVNIEIVNRAGKFNLRYKDDNSVILGRFSSENTAELVKNILVEHGEDINYFENNNIFENNGRYYIFILKEDKITHLGFASSYEDAERKLKLKLNKNNIPDKTGEEFIFKSDDRYLIIKNNKTFGEFMSMEYATAVKKFLSTYNWNVGKVKEIGNIFGLNGKFFLLEQKGDKITIGGVFDSYSGASQELSKLNKEKL